MRDKKKLEQHIRVILRNKTQRGKKATREDSAGPN